MLQSLGAGDRLDPEIRDSFEPHFDADLSGVRVHSGEEAARSARNVNARAFTIGRDIVFGEREYQPQTSEGRRLLAHELTHVVQQSTGPLIVQRAVVLTADDYKALAEQIHKAMKGLGTDEEAIYVSLQKLEKDPTAITKLTEAYKKEFKGADLEADIRSEMSRTELQFALELLGIKDDPKAADIVGTAPTTDAEYKAVAKKLHAAMKGPGTNEEVIYGLLMPFKRDEPKLTKLKTIYQSELSGGLTGSGLEADIKDEMSTDELAYALFLLNAPPPAVPAAATTVGAAGTQVHKEKVAGGEVSVRTGVTYTAAGNTYTGGFSVGYKGGQAPDSGWIQFIWAEIVATQPDGSDKYVADTGLATTQSATMDLTTDPTKPKYKVDSGSASSPFYEAAGTDIRTATDTTYYDRPSEFGAQIQREFTNGATKVVERDHFDGFLIRDYKTMYRVSVLVQWKYTAPATVNRTTKFQSASKVNAMPSIIRNQLVKEYPKFDYIM